MPRSRLHERMDNVCKLVVNSVVNCQVTEAQVVDQARCPPAGLQGTIQVQLHHITTFLQCMGQAPATDLTQDHTGHV